MFLPDAERNNSPISAVHSAVFRGIAPRKMYSIFQGGERGEPLLILVVRDEGVRLACLTSTASSTNTVNVVRIAVWLIEVDDMTNIRNV